MQDEVTSIKIRKFVVEKLKKLKKYRRETHEDIILRLLDKNDEKGVQ